MKYPKNLTYPPHHPHELARRQAKCQERIQHHTIHASFQGLIGLAFLGFGLHYAQKNEIVVPLFAAPSAAYAFSKSSTSFLKRQKWLKESQRLQKY